MKVEMLVYTRFGGSTAKPRDVLTGVPSGVAERWIRAGIAKPVEGERTDEKPLDEYLKGELIEYAQKSGIEIDEKAKKDEILKDIRQALGGE